MESSLRVKKDNYIISINKNKLKKKLKDKRMKILKSLKNQNIVEEQEQKILKKSKIEIFEIFEKIKKNKNFENEKKKEELLKSIKIIRIYYNNQSKYDLDNLINEFFKKGYFFYFLEILKNEKNLDKNLVKEIIWFFIALFSLDECYAIYYINLTELDIFLNLYKNFFYDEKFLETVK